MNERIINDLAVKSGLAEDMGRGYKFPDNYLDFAQLIVRECAEVCYDHSNAAGGVDTDFGYGYKDCGDDIKRNFGVEE